MTSCEMIQLLAKFPADTRIVHAFDWSDDVVLDDYTNVSDGNGGPGIPTLALTSTISAASPVSLDSTPHGPFVP